MTIKLEFETEDNMTCKPFEMDVIPRTGEFIVVQGHEFPIERVVYEIVKPAICVRLDLGKGQKLYP